MQLRFSAVCEDAQPRTDGRLDVNGVFHSLPAPGFPALQDHMVLVIVIEWDREDHGRYRFQVTLDHETEPFSERVLDVETEVRKPTAFEAGAKTPVIVPMHEVLFPHSGQYTFRIKAKGKTIDGPGIYLVEVPEAQTDT